MDKIRFATVWLAGCSGCHMSFLDLDEFLIDLADLVEGAIANDDNLELIYQVRRHTKILISFGDCAVTANVPAMRNMLRDSAEGVLERGYLELADEHPQLPHAPGIVPELLDRVVPVHEVVPVDIFMPGCPPSADRIRATLEPLLQGQTPTMAGRPMIKFG